MKLNIIPEMPTFNLSNEQVIKKKELLMNEVKQIKLIDT